MLNFRIGFAQLSMLPDSNHVLLRPINPLPTRSRTHSTSTPPGPLPSSPPSQLRSLHRQQLLLPRDRPPSPPHRPHLIRTKPRHANVVGALQHQGDVPGLEQVGVAQFGEAAGGFDERVDEVVGEV